MPIENLLNLIQTAFPRYDKLVLREMTLEEAQISDTHSLKGVVGVNETIDEENFYIFLEFSFEKQITKIGSYQPIRVSFRHAQAIMQDNQQMKTTPNLLGNNVSKTYFTYKNKQRIIFSTIFRVMYGNISYDS